MNVKYGAAWAAGLLAVTCAFGAVEGRYVRIDALTHTMENSEFEVFSGGKNLVQGHPEMLSSGSGWGGYGTYDSASSVHYRRLLTDGNTSLDQRGSVRAPDPKTSFAHMEADLGKSVPIDSVAFRVSRWDNPQIKVWFDDPDGWRVVTVMDEKRKVICSYLVTLYTPEFKKQKGVLSVRPERGVGPFAGRFIDPASRGWFSLGEFLIGYLDVKAVSTPAEAERAARVAEFAQRNTPEALAAFAQRFFADVDLGRPELNVAKRRLADGRPAEALDESWYGNDFWDTQYHYWDFGEPLLLSRPLLVDGLNQCQSFETRGWKPGSKTERLVEAPEQPLPNRFHCSARYDYQECFYTGAYQNWDIEMSKGESPRKQLKISGTAVTNVYATRQIIQLREPRLFVVVDRIRFSDSAPHQVSARFMLLPVDKESRVEADAGKGEIRLVRPAGAQLTVRQFGAKGRAYEALKPAQEQVALAVQSKEDLWSGLALGTGTVNFGGKTLKRPAASSMSPWRAFTPSTVPKNMW